MKLARPDASRLNLVKAEEKRQAFYGDPLTRTEKYCPRCKKFVDVQWFRRDRARLDGRAGECKPCYELERYEEI